MWCNHDVLKPGHILIPMVNQPKRLAGHPVLADQIAVKIIVSGNRQYI
jgi:hypothetical protein